MELWPDRVGHLLSCNENAESKHLWLPGKRELMLDVKELAVKKKKICLVKKRCQYWL